MYTKSYIKAKADLSMNHIIRWSFNTCLCSVQVYQEYMSTHFRLSSHHLKKRDDLAIPHAFPYNHLKTCLNKRWNGEWLEQMETLLGFTNTKYVKYLFVRSLKLTFYHAY